MIRHRWYSPRNLPSLTLCRICGASQGAVGQDSPCLIARSSDPAIDALYRKRRRAASEADGSGMKATKGWAELEATQAILEQLDPDGDWRYEGNRYDGLGWQVRRPAASELISDPHDRAVADRAGGPGPEEPAEHSEASECDLVYEGHVGAPGYGVSYKCRTCGRPWLKVGQGFVDPREAVYELSPEDVI